MWGGQTAAGSTLRDEGGLSKASDRQVTPAEVVIPEMNLRQGAAQFRYCTPTKGIMELGLGVGLGGGGGVSLCRARRG